MTRQFGGSSHARVSQPTIHVTVANVTLKLTIVLVTVTMVSNFGRRIHGRVVKFNDRVRVLPCVARSAASSRPLIVPPALRGRLGTVSGMDTVRRIVAGPNVVGAAATFRNVVLGNISSACG